jgi:hypothetical protein
VSAGIARAALLVLLVLPGAVARAETPRVEIDVTPVEVTVGDPISVQLRVVVDPTTRFDPPDLGGRFGDLEVLDGSWTGPVTTGEERTWAWRGRVAAFEVGPAEVPAVVLRVEGPEGGRELSTTPVEVEVRSVISEEEAEPVLADLKPPVSIAPDYRPLWLSLVILAILLAVAAVAWWTYRRVSTRLAAVPQEDDPFRRMPPHEWVYAELKALLGRGWAERGEVARFHEELARIVKRYLGARYRVELLEHTTGEIRDLLTVAGTPADAAARASELLQACDRVKFAREMPDVDSCRRLVEDAYGIVDATRPRDLQKGAA